MTETYTERTDRLFVFLVRGDFARGQRYQPLDETHIGSFATGQRMLPATAVSSQLRA